MFNLTIKTNAAAFGEDAPTEREELARILRDAADRLDDGQDFGTLRDINGNTVGEFNRR